MENVCYGMLINTVYFLIKVEVLNVGSLGTVNRFVDNVAVLFKVLIKDLTKEGKF